MELPEERRARQYSTASRSLGEAGYPEPVDVREVPLPPSASGTDASVIEPSGTDVRDIESSDPDAIVFESSDKDARFFEPSVFGHKKAASRAAALAAGKDNPFRRPDCRCRR